MKRVRCGLYSVNPLEAWKEMATSWLGIVNPQRSYGTSQYKCLGSCPTHPFMFTAGPLRKQERRVSHNSRGSFASGQLSTGWEIFGQGFDLLLCWLRGYLRTVVGYDLMAGLGCACPPFYKDPPILRIHKYICPIG